MAKERVKVFLCDLAHNYTLGENQISGDTDHCVPLNIGEIGSYAKEVFRDSVELRLFKYPDDLLSALETERPHILGFSNYGWSADLNLRVGSYIREHYPEILLVMGGPSIRTDRSGIYAFLKQHPYVDIYVMYEGETVFAEIIRSYNREGRKILNKDSKLPSCAFLVDDTLVYNELKPTMPIDHFPSPYLNGMLDEFLEQRLIPLFETNRGCPFACTFCNWGFSVLNRVRKHSMDRIFAEFDYVAKKFPHHRSWFFADANFGILPRDVDIARKLREVKDRTPALRNIHMYESKNTSDRNFEIAKILKSDFGDILMAVQTLDDKALEAIKRKNISMAHVPEKVQAFKEAGTRVSTDVLVGSPNETFEGHLNTLRKCFDAGFDNIQVFNIQLLPGSEMETDDSRSRYQIKTMFRTRSGNYGEYHGIKAIECEEVIRSNSAISEQEIKSLRRIQWLVWYAWNHGFLKPLLQFAHQEQGINPIDVICGIALGNNERHAAINRMFIDFDRDAESEWFDSYQSLRKFYTEPKRWKEFLNRGFSKVEFKYNALMILDRRLFCGMIDCAIDIISECVSSPYPQEIKRFLLELRIEPEFIRTHYVQEVKEMNIPPQIARYVADSGSGGGQNTIRTHVPSRQIEGNQLVLRKRYRDQDEIRNRLSKFGYERDKGFSVEKTLGSISDAFVYDVSLIQKDHENTDTLEVSDEDSVTVA